MTHILQHPVNDRGWRIVTDFEPRTAPPGLSLSITILLGGSFYRWLWALSAEPDGLCLPCSGVLRGLLLPPYPPWPSAPPVSEKRANMGGTIHGGTLNFKIITAVSLSSSLGITLRRLVSWNLSRTWRYSCANKALKAQCSCYFSIGQHNHFSLSWFVENWLIWHT